MEEIQWSIGGAYSVFPALARMFGLKTFIETGTAYGDMAVHMYNAFQNIYTIELDPWPYRISKAIFVNFPRINLIQGNSGEQLEILLRDLPNTPTLFWLDAHDPNPGPGCQGPIDKEITIIKKYRPLSLIAIDDVGPGQHHDPNLPNIPLDGWTKDYRFNRVLFLHQGQFNIPYFGQ